MSPQGENLVVGVTVAEERSALTPALFAARAIARARSLPRKISATSFLDLGIGFHL